jgi:hypothetical protein
MESRWQLKDMKTSKTTTIEWLCSAAVRNLSDLEQSNLASVRLRTAVGIKATLASGRKNILSDGFSNYRADVIVVGKLDYINDPSRASRWLARIQSLKVAGAKIIVDYTDHHMAKQSPAGFFYRDAIALADTIVASSHKLCEHILVSTGRQAVMIDDPIEIPVTQPRVRNNATKTALWFGHASNLPYLFDYLRERYVSNSARRLIVMTNQHPLPEAYIKSLEIPNLSSLEINVIPWSANDMITAANLADICLLPAGMMDPRKSGASSNRLLTALALGLPTAADMLDSYAPLSAYFMDLRDTDLDRMLDEPESLFPKVQDAQQLIASEHTIPAAMQRWSRLLLAEKEFAAT